MSTKQAIGLVVAGLLLLVAGAGAGAAAMSHLSSSSSAHVSDVRETRDPLDGPKVSASARAAGLSGEVPVLGRPTATSIVASVVTTEAAEVYVEYGTAAGDYRTSTKPSTSRPGAPHSVTIAGLEAATRYHYRAVIDGRPGADHSFVTQRAPGSTYTFTVDADPHGGDPRFVGGLFARTLETARADDPDFHVDLGDTFMTEKAAVRTYEEAGATFSTMRPYFAAIAADAPLFLVNGNHEGEVGWPAKDNASSELPAWCAKLRQSWFPGPMPGDFYSGATSTDPLTGAPRDGYYAYRWGDALFITLDPFWYTTRKPGKAPDYDGWGWTLGREQYDWLAKTLETNEAPYVFVFTHHLVGGASEARGGVEVANLYEWGGQNADGSAGFDAKRPGWGMPIHDLFVEHGVTAVFHGHDHAYVRQELDGVVYQELPQPSNAGYDKTELAKEYGYTSGTVFGSSGYLRVTVSPEKATAEYVRVYLPQDETAQRRTGQVSDSYAMDPRR